MRPANAAAPIIRAHLITALGVLALAQTAPHRAQAQPQFNPPQIAPATGFTTFSGDARDQIEALLAPPNGPAGGGPGGRAWQTSLFLEVDQEWTNNLQQTTGGYGSPQSDAAFITLIRPGLSISGESPRVSGALNFSPTLNIYEGSPGNQPRFVPSLSGSGLFTVVPQTIYVSANAYATEQPRYGGVNNGALSASNSVQTYSYSVSPYAVRQYGDLGVAQIGATLSQTFQNVATAGQANSLGASTGGSASATEHASFTTGQAFGRLMLTLSVTSAQYGGGSAVPGLSRTEALDSSYALTHEFFLTGHIADQQVHYGGVTPYNFTGPSYTGGFNWTPNPDSTVSMSYGYVQGRDVVQGQINYRISGRTVLFASSSAGSSTAAQELQGALNGSNVTAGGGMVNAGNGAPVQALNGAVTPTNLGVVYYLQQQSAGSATSFDRDTIGLTISHSTRTLLTATVATSPGQTSSSLSGGITWSHQVSETTSLYAGLQVGNNTNSSSETTGTGGTIPIVQRGAFTGANVGLTKSLSETLSTFLRYNYSSNIQTTAFGFGQPVYNPVPSQTVLAGLRKTF